MTFKKGVSCLPRQKSGREARSQPLARQSAARRKEREAEIEGGVTVSPVPLTLGERVTIRYKGRLAQSGASQIYLHRGYGPAHSWTSVADIPMEKSNGSWEARFEVHDGSRLNFCFRDHAGNWDNNNGRDWSLEVHTGERP